MVYGTTFAVKSQKLMRTLGEEMSDFAATALDEGNAHLIVTGSLMTEPRDGGGFGALLNGNALGAGDRTAPYGSGVSGDKIGEALGIASMRAMEGEKR